MCIRDRLALAADDVVIGTFGRSDPPKGPASAVIARRLEGLGAESEVTGHRGCRPGTASVALVVTVLRRSTLR